LKRTLRFLRAESKNRERENGRKTGNATLKAIEHLHRNKMIVVGGLIVRSPGDTREAVEANLEFARRYVDWPYIQHPTPYPGTPMTKDFRDRRLIINERLEEYDGTTAVVRTEHLAADEVEFLQWRAERWMKLRPVTSGPWHASGALLRTQKVRSLALSGRAYYPTTSVNERDLARLPFALADWTIAEGCGKPTSPGLVCNGLCMGRRHSRGGLSLWFRPV